MPTITVQSPLDQPSGNLRLINELKNQLLSDDFNAFYIISAFAKVSPLLKLKPEFDIWLAKGNSINIAFGIDEKGTSKQALSFALANFTHAYIARVGNSKRSTFHPKIYLFTGLTEAVAYIGSNNLTSGGIETNAESYVKFEMTFPGDSTLRNQFIRCWDETLTISLTLDENLIDRLLRKGWVLNESQMRSERAERNARPENREAEEIIIQFPEFRIVPNIPIPRTVLTETTRHEVGEEVVISLLEEMQSFVLEIIVHHNGEILLSKTATNQNPAFFGWPFTGRTVPKRESNPSYPQREPDPIVDIFIYNAEGNNIHTQHRHNLNTVYYTLKGEIRITIPQGIVHLIPEFSLLVLRKSLTVGLDYDILIYQEGSQDYRMYLEVCNQSMPSGGNIRARRFGWL